MAIKIKFDDRFGASHAEAYVRVAGISLEFTDKKLTIDALTYTSEAARQDGKPPLGLKQYDLKGDKFDEAVIGLDSDPREFAYGHLKTLAEFEGGKDA